MSKASGPSKTNLLTIITWTLRDLREEVNKRHKAKRKGTRERAGMVGMSMIVLG